MSVWNGVVVSPLQAVYEKVDGKKEGNGGSESVDGCGGGEGEEDDMENEEGDGDGDEQMD